MVNQCAPCPRLLHEHHPHLPPIAPHLMPSPPPDDELMCSPSPPPARMSSPPPDDNLMRSPSSASERWWDVQETGTWTEDLWSAFQSFARLDVWGGPAWQECVSAFVAFEGAWSFPDKGLLSAPTEVGSWPLEIVTFMRNARRWGAPVDLLSKAGAEAQVGPWSANGSFAQRWAAWWVRMRLEGQAGDDVASPKQPEGLDPKDWEELVKMHGRNGLLFVVAGFT
ncbi:hypothetical protein DFH07DRAFT_965032 [Mycena maculata]|uniref:Uncharacterized protein n=1 Tax=Mycena maculata TaxID=230809 RepID=A0AAD7N1G7_9AGAR|nr:hypothetical protein DFH07DRAFT_965032 [Mycena maculata]